MDRSIKDYVEKLGHPSWADVAAWPDDAIQELKMVELLAKVLRQHVNKKDDFVMRVVVEAPKWVQTLQHAAMFNLLPALMAYPVELLDLIMVNVLAQGYEIANPEDEWRDVLGRPSALVTASSVDKYLMSGAKVHGLVKIVDGDMKRSMRWWSSQALRSAIEHPEKGISVLVVAETVDQAEAERLVASVSGIMCSDVNLDDKDGVAVWFARGTMPPDEMTPQEDRWLSAIMGRVMEWPQGDWPLEISQLGTKEGLAEGRWRIRLGSGFVYDCRTRIIERAGKVVAGPLIQPPRFPLESDRWKAAAWSSGILEAALLDAGAKQRAKMRCAE